AGILNIEADVAELNRKHRDSARERPGSVRYSATGHLHARTDGRAGHGTSHGRIHHPRRLLARGGIHRGLPGDAPRMARPSAFQPRGMTEVIVDTDVVSFVFKNHPIGSRYDPELAGKVAAISFMTVAELERW